MSARVRHAGLGFIIYLHFERFTIIEKIIFNIFSFCVEIILLVESSGGNGWSIFFAVILIILLVIGIVYAYNMYLDHIVVTEGAMKTELGIRK